MTKATTEDVMAAVRDLEAKLEVIFTAFPVVLELAQETLDRREMLSRAGRSGGQKSGEKRRATKPASTSNSGQSKPASRAKRSQLRETGENARSRLRSTGNDSEINSKPASSAEFPLPIRKRVGESLIGTGTDPDSEESIEKYTPVEPAENPEAGFDLDVPEPSGKRSRGRPKKPPVPGFVQCRDLFETFYQRDYGGKPTRNGRTAGQLASLLSQHGAEEVTRRITIAFTTPPAWPPPPYGYDELVKHFDRFVVPPKKPAAVGASGLAFGRFEPSRETDYRSPWEIKRNPIPPKPIAHANVDDLPPWDKP